MRAGWLAAVAAAVALVIPSPSYGSFSIPTPSIFTDASRADVVPPGVVYVAPFPRDSGANIAPMLWQAEARMRFAMPGGYVLVPDAAGRLRSTARPVDALSAVVLGLQVGQVAPPRPAWAALRAQLIADHATAVLVGPMEHEDAVRGFFTALLGSPPRHVGGVWLWLSPSRAPPSPGGRARI